MEYQRKKKSDKAKKNFELHGKNTARGVRFMENILAKAKPTPPAKN